MRNCRRETVCELTIVDKSKMKLDGGIADFRAICSNCGLNYPKDYATKYAAAARWYREHGKKHEEAQALAKQNWQSAKVITLETKKKTSATAKVYTKKKKKPLLIATNNYTTSVGLYINEQ